MGSCNLIFLGDQPSTIRPDIVWERGRPDIVWERGFIVFLKNLIYFLLKFNIFCMF
jgi:hypothetical protein